MESASRSSVTVAIRMVFRRFFGVMFGVDRVPVRDVRMMAGFLVVAGFVMLGGFVVVPGGMFEMLGGFPVMFGCLLAHSVLLTRFLMWRTHCGRRPANGLRRPASESAPGVYSSDITA